MRIAFIGLLLLSVACRRPSTKLAATLTPPDQPNQPLTAVPTPEITDYSPYFKAANPSAGAEAVALGSEPASWSLTIGGANGRLRFSLGNGDTLSAPVPSRTEETNGGFRYEAEAGSGRITARFRPDSCVDKASGQRFDYRVDVVVGDKTYVGCGASLREVAGLQANWLLREFGSRSLVGGGPRNELPRLDFSLADGRVTGTTGCNRLNGTFRADSRQLQFGPLLRTKIGCPGEAGRLEGDFVEALSQRLTYRVAAGSLTLLRDGKVIMIFQKVD